MRHAIDTQCRAASLGYHGVLLRKRLRLTRGYMKQYGATSLIPDGRPGGTSVEISEESSGSSEERRDRS